jgi:ABC-type branched-subunit amino acid transport system substrate-binding protein
VGLAVCAALALACAGGGATHVDLGNPERDYAEALRIASKDPAAGAERLRAFLDGHPESDLADDAGVRLAQLERDAGAPREAAKVLARVVKRQPHGDQTDRARLELAELLAERGERGAAYDAARPIDLSRLSLPERQRALALLTRLAHESGDGAEEIAWLGQSRAAARTAADVAASERALDAAIGALRPNELEGVARDLDKRVPAARVWLALANERLAAGDTQAAERALGEARRAPLLGDDAAALARLSSRLTGDHGAASLLAMADLEVGAPIADAKGARGTLAVALPLSGELAAFGEESLNGVLLAAGFFGSGAPPPDLAVEVRDTGGSAAGAKAALDALAADERVLGVVGPLTGDEGEAAAAAAEAAGLPLLTLSRREGLELGRTSVFPLALSPRVEAELVAEYATAKLGLHRFALLYPDDAYGETVRAAFWDAVEARGGEVVGVAHYAPGTQDFSTPVRRLVGYDLLPAETLKALEEREAMRKRARRLPPKQALELRTAADAMTAPDGSPLPPFVDFEALFVPDSYESVGLIAPHLAFQGVLGVRLLGTSSWQDPNLLRLGAQHLDGAVFPTGFVAGSARPHLAAFEASYQRAFGRAPSYLAAQSFDAATLLLRALATGADSRPDVLARLRRGVVLAGASGVIAIDENGRVTKRPHLLGIERGAFMSVDESGAPPFLRTPPPPTTAPAVPAQAAPPRTGPP